MSLGMSAQMLGSHGTVGAVRAVQPARADVMFMFEVGMEVVSSLGLKVAERAVYPVDVDAVLGGEVHGEVLFGFVLQRGQRKSGVAVSGMWQQHGPPGKISSLRRVEQVHDADGDRVGVGRRLAVCRERFGSAGCGSVPCHVG